MGNQDSDVVVAAATQHEQGNNKGAGVAQSDLPRVLLISAGASHSVALLCKPFVLDSCFHWFIH